MRRERGDRRREPSRDPALLMDMLMAAKAVQEFVTGKTWEQYASDLLFRSAVERQIEIIGEAARGVSDQTRARIAAIPWHAVIAQRHRLSHEYGEIDDTIIWRVATVHISSLIETLQREVPQS